MAEFNPFLPQSNIPNWTDAPGRLIDGSGFGEIFANVAQNTGKAVAEANVKRNTDKLYKEADAAADEGHLEGFAAAAGLPVDVARGMSKPELWKKAFEKGNYSDSFFYTKMDAWAKEMKAKYPNYVEEIDRQTARVMGKTPANALYDEMRSNYDALNKAQDAAKSKEMKFLEDNAQYIDPKYIENWGSLDDNTRNRVQLDAVIKKGDQARFDQDRKNLETNSKAGALEAAPVLSKGIENLQRSFWMGATDTAGSYANLNDTIRKMAEGGFSSEELTQITEIVTKKKQEIVSSWQTLITTQGENGKSLQDYFAANPEMFAAQEKKITEMLKGLDDLSQGKTGYVEWNSTMATVEKDSRIQKMKDVLGEDAYNGILGMQEVLGPGVYETVMANSMQKNDVVQKAMDGILAGVTFKEGNIGTATKEFLDSADPSLRPQANKAARQNVETQISIAVNPQLSIDARKKSLTAILADKDNTFLRTLKDVPDNTGLSSREKFFLRMQDPEVAKTAASLGMAKEYTQWVKNTGVALLAGNVEQINASNKSTSYMDIRFNPETMQFESKLSDKVSNPTQLGKYIAARRSGKTYGAWNEIPKDIPLQDLDAIKAGVDSVQKMNMVTKGLVQAIKADNPGITDEQLVKQLEGYFGDVQATYQKEDYWQTSALKAIGSYLKDAVTGKVASDNAARVQKTQEELTQGADFGVVPQGDTNFVTADGTATSTVGTQPNTGDSSADGILAFVHGAEGADYNTVYGGGKVNASSMTVADVLARTDNAGSSAFGATQVMKDTLNNLVKAGKISPTQVMDQSTQDQIGMALLEKAGLSDWKSGKLSDNAFADRLAGVWASLPLASGASKYDNVGPNKSTVSRQQVLAMLAQYK